jgi:hypothetical protein
VGLGALVGIPSSRITTELAGVFNTLFNSAMKTVWEAGPWLEVSPRGEARFAGSKLTYPNDLSASVWTGTALTITKNSIANPLDGRTTASKAMETAANSAHSVEQTVDIVIDTTYALSAYVRPNGRSWAYLKFNDGVNDYTAFFDATTGTVGTVAGTGATATITQQGNGYWLCTLDFTTAATASATGTATVQVSSDGATLSYAGDTAKGLYIWGVLLQQTSNTGINDYVISWDQDGEDEINAVFEVYQTNPFATMLPRPQRYQLGPDGITLISGTWGSYYVNGVNQNTIYGANPANPVFLYYRKSVPDYSGDTYDATDTYAVDEQVYFVNSIGNGDFYKCLTATSAGESPDSAAAKWEVIPFYSVFYNYVLWQSYGDWLVSDGQADKAQGAYAMAQKKMDDEFDVLERQMGDVMPTKVQTHVTTQARNY